MGKKDHGIGQKGSLLCPVCKNRVDTIIKGRHKSLGAYVPVWGPGPCHSPDCSEHVEAPEHTRTPDHS